MFKIRMHASGRQTRQWDVGVREAGADQRPIFYVKGARPADSVAEILMRPEPWFEQDTGRLEYVNRIKLWRYLTEDADYDADYWLTRLEHAPPVMA